MNTADQCIKCSPTSTCGFSCYFYWHRGRPARKIREMSTTDSRGKTSQEDLHPNPNKTKSKSKRPREVINLCEDSEEDETPGTEVVQDRLVLSRHTHISKRTSTYESHKHRNQAVPSFRSVIQQSRDPLEAAGLTLQLESDSPHYGDPARITRDESIYEDLQSCQASEQASISTESSSEPTSKLMISDNLLKFDISPKKHSPDSLSCVERKRIIVNDRPETVSAAMQTWHDRTLSLFDPFRSSEDCWFHPSPPLPKKASGDRSLSHMLVPQARAKTTIAKKFGWTDSTGRHALNLNFGIVSKLLDRKISKQQKDGFITKGWHLSHLCGNWTCLNPNHATVEPGQINLARNNCFSHRSGCAHEPPCMKEKKVPLGLGVAAQDEVSFGFDDNGLEDWQSPWFEDDDSLHAFVKEPFDIHSVSSEAFGTVLESHGGDGSA